MGKNDIYHISELRERINRKFIESGWITVSDDGIHCALVSDDSIQTCMNSDQWDLRRGDNGFYELQGEGSCYYHRIGDALIEPLVLWRDCCFEINSFVELSEDFRLYNNMYQFASDRYHAIFKISDENGEWEEVVRVNEICVTIKVALLRKYMAMRKKNLIIFFDQKVNSEKSYEELDSIPAKDSVVKGDDFIYNYSTIIQSNANGNNSVRRILGKCLLKYDVTDYISEQQDLNNKSEKFIIGYDDKGDLVTHSCNKRTLSNFFSHNGNEPLETTPVFFKKEILDKYYSNPNNYLVQDGQLSCRDSWSLLIDNDQRNYVVVLLSDLGCLPYSEQQYWKSKNVPKDNTMSISMTQYKRWIEGFFCNPSFPDLLFKNRYNAFSEKWKEKYGWDLFLPLTKEDEHSFIALHCLTTRENDLDFDVQVLSLAKLMIDSLNQKELLKNSIEDNSLVKSFLEKRGHSSLSELSAGIDKFECYLISQGASFPEMIDDFRKLQSLRSYSVAHRKSSDQKDLRKVYDYFGCKLYTGQELLENIFAKMTCALNTLNVFFLNLV